MKKEINKEKERLRIRRHNINLTIRRAAGIILLIFAISIAFILIYAVFEFFIHFICFGMYKSTTMTKGFFNRYL